MEPISGIETVQKERRELSWCICRQRMGAKIQCGNCYTAFHPLCGRYVHAEDRGRSEPIEIHA
jgi:NuA3 HAT complex component NTO1